MKNNSMTPCVHDHAMDATEANDKLHSLEEVFDDLVVDCDDEFRS